MTEVRKSPTKSDSMRYLDLNIEIQEGKDDEPKQVTGRRAR